MLKTDITPEMHRKIVELYRNDVSVEEMSNRLGIPYSEIYNYIVQSKIIAKKKFFTSEMHNTLVKLWYENVPVKDIAKKMHISPQIIYGHIKCYGGFPQRRRVIAKK